MLITFFISPFFFLSHKFSCAIRARVFKFCINLDNGESGVKVKTEMLRFFFFLPISPMQ